MSGTGTAAPPPWREEDRLAALARYGLLDTPREAEFDDIVEMAAQACGMPIAHLNLIDRDRQWFKAETGLGVRQMPLHPSICTQALLEREMLVVPDLRADPRFAGNPLVTGAPHLVSYAGVPLRSPEGLPIGVLCVLGHAPRTLTEPQRFILRALGRTVMAQLEQRRATIERDEAHERHRQAEARSQQILDSAIDYGIISFDLQGRVTSWNEGARRVMGWTEAEMLGQTADRLFTPDDVAAGIPQIEMGNAATYGHAQDERWHLREDHTRFFASGEMMTLRDQAGTLTGFIKILRDRTEQHRTGKALQDSQERLEIALGTGLVGFFDWDTVTGLLHGDTCFAVLHGLDAARVGAGIAMDDLHRTIHPGDRDPVARQAQAALTSRDDYTTQFRVLRPDGTLRWLLARGRCYEHDGIRARRYTGIVIDITAAKESEAALQASEEFTRRVLASSADCIKVLDLDAKLLFMSEGGQRVMEVSDFNAIRGCPWPDFWAGPGHAEAKAAVEAAKAGRTGQFRGVADTMAGTTKSWDVQVTPILGADGRPEKLLSVSRDITAAYQAEAALRESEAHWRGLFEKLHEGLILGELVRGADGRVTDWRCLDVNAAWGVLVGIAPGAATGRTIRQLFPGIEDEWVDEMAGVVATREPATFTRQVGSIGRWYEGHAFALEGDRFAMLFLEVTDRKQADARRLALLELNDRLRDLDDPAEMAFAAAETIGRTLQAGRAGYGTMTGDGEGLIVERDWTAPGTPSIAGRHRMRNYGSFIENLRRGETVAITDAGLDPRTAANTAALDTVAVRALVNLPLIEQGRLVAVFFVNCAEPRPWQAEELGFVRSVAERARSAIERRRAEHRLRSLAASLEQQVEERTRERDRIWRVSRDMLGVADGRGVWVSVNPAWTRILGWPAEQIVGTTSEWLEHPEDQQKTREQVMRLAAGHATTGFENRFRTTDGTYRMLNWTAVQVEGLLYCVARDVTEERERERALHESQDFIRLALSAVGGVGVWTYDVADDRFFCDAAIAELYGLDAAEARAGIERERFLANVHPDDLLRLRTVMGDGLVRSGDLELEYRLRHPDGSIRWVLSRGHTYFDESGQPSRRSGVGIETTKQHQMEEQLRQSQKMEAVGQLTGGLAHDFNNLLTGIIGSLELMGTRVAQGRLRDVDRYIGAAQGAAKRAAALTHRLLAFSRRQTLDPSPTDINRLIVDMEEIIRGTVGPAVEIEVVGAAGLWTALVDANQLENALLNLCINARDAMPDGGRITIETANRLLDQRAARERDLAPGQYLSLCVTDTGTGMTPDVIARAFDPFFTTKPMGQGTGLGLSMIYGFARQSGGQVRIYSEVGQGTTMCLYLPRYHGEADEPAAGTELSDAPRAEQGETVLIVDDEPTVRMLVTEVLEDLGYVAIEATDGAAGLQVLQSDVRIDLLITDVGLPGGMNGRQVADAGRTVRPGLKVLFITGYAENAVIGNGHLDPGMHVLTKPFVLEVLASRIKELIAG